jgi:hypothetical protein
MDFLVNPFEIENSLSDRDLDNFYQWARFISKSKLTLWAVVWHSIKEHCSSKEWETAWIQLQSYMGKSIEKSMTYVQWCLDGEYAHTACIAGYVASFFPQVPNDEFKPAAELWKRGFVPSYDGTTWRLHAGKDAKIICEVPVATITEKPNLI